MESGSSWSICLKYLVRSSEVVWDCFYGTLHGSLCKIEDSGNQADVKSEITLKMTIYTNVSFLMRNYVTLINIRNIRVESLSFAGKYINIYLIKKIELS